MLETAPTITSPRPLRYHRELRDFLRSNERGLWDWFSSAQAKEEHFEAQRLDLLKTTVRLDQESQPELHAALAEVAERLGLSVPRRIYQAQQTSEPNTMLAYIPGELHLIFCGSILTLLTPGELRVLLAHELAHYILWQLDGGDFLTATRLLDAAASHPEAANCHQQSARCWSLYTEIFADRVALEVTGDLEASVTSLVKTATGLAQVSGRGYLAQAEEVFAKGKVRTEQLTHPELFIRARALALWHAGEDAAETHIAEILEGAPSLDELDWLGQQRLTILTRRFLGQLLRPRWFQTPATLAHARLFFEDFTPAASDDAGLVAEVKAASLNLREYFAWLLADFVLSDSELEDLPLAAALEWSRQLGIDDAFDKLAHKELKMKVRELKKAKAGAAQLLANAEAAV